MNPRPHAPFGLAARRPRSGFTLIELLVVISIIALLIGILLPALSAARASARMVSCLSNTRQMGIGALAYANDFELYLPATDGVDASGQETYEESNWWGWGITPYIYSHAIQRPADQNEARERWLGEMADNNIFICPEADPGDATYHQQRYISLFQRTNPSDYIGVDADGNFRANGPIGSAVASGFRVDQARGSRMAMHFDGKSGWSASDPFLGAGGGTLGWGNAVDGGEGGRLRHTDGTALAMGTIDGASKSFRFKSGMDNDAFKEWDWEAENVHWVTDNDPRYTP